MALFTVLWEKWVEFRRDWLQITLSSLVSPLLYILTFGLGLGQALAVDGRAYLDFLLPGVVALTTMNSSFNAIGMSLNVQRLYEHSFDNIMISPTPMWQYILGQMTAGSLRGMYAGCLVIIVGLCFGANMALNPMFFAVMLLNGMTFASLLFSENQICKHISPYSHSLRSTFPRFLFPLGYGGLKRVLACKFVFFSVFPQFSKLWVSNWYHSLVSFRLKNRLGKSDYSFQKSDTWTGTH